MADGPDHHAMSALMQNASGGSEQGGGGKSGLDQEYGAKMFGEGAGLDKIGEGFDKSVTGKHNDDLMMSAMQGKPITPDFAKGNEYIKTGPITPPNVASPQGFLSSTKGGEGRG